MKRTAVRYLIAFFMMMYGIAKLTGAQFTVLDSELDKPLGEVSGFWLTWYYFGYSTGYGIFIALAEIAGGVLLLSRRTMVLGALVLLPVLANVVLVDVFFGIDGGAFVIALLLLAGVLSILRPYARELWEAVWTRPARLAQAAPRTRARTAAKAVACAAMVAAAAGWTYYLANHVNVAPTPVDGAWRVVERPAALAARVPSVIYFERRRRWTAVFRYPDRWETHHFEVDPARRSLGIWRDWESKGPRLFEGAYELRRDRLRLTGRFAGHAEPVTLVLERHPVAGRGFTTRP